MQEKEFNEYTQRNDCANGRELIVTITLAEYRELLEHKVRAMEWQNRLHMENEKLRRQLERLDGEPQCDLS